MSLLVEDRELRQRFRRGEPAALEQVFNHYVRPVTALLRRGFTFRAGGQTVRFGGYDGIFDLEDSLQEIFRRALSENARHNYDGLRPYRTYLTAIARNVVIDGYQARRRALERYAVEEPGSEPSDDAWSVADDPLADAAATITGNPERDAETRELRALLREFKDRLTGRERTVFCLRFEEGLSHTQITARSGVSPSKIKTTEARIRKSLLKFLRKRGYLEHSGHRALASQSIEDLPQGGAP